MVSRGDFFGRGILELPLKGFPSITDKIGHKVDTSIVLNDQLCLLVDELSIERKTIDKGPDKQEDLTLQLSKCKGILGSKEISCVVWY